MGHAGVAHPTCDNMNVLVWNIEGLSSRIAEPGFLDYVANFNICCFTETFTAVDFDFSIHFSEYLIFHSPAIKLSRHGRRSGGVVVLVKKPHACTAKVSPIPCELDNTLVLRVSSPSRNDIIFVFMYVPPRDSPYYKDKVIKCNLDLLGETLIDLEEAYPHTTILICGDLNARTGNWNLHCDPDFQTDEENICYCPDHSASRQSQDSYINHFGEVLINLCRIHHMYIENGSNIGDKDGKFTYISPHGDSVVDYCLIANGNTNMKSSISVGSRIESSHMPMEISIGIEKGANTKLKQHSISKIVWDRSKEDEVLENIRSITFKNLLSSAQLSLDSSLDFSVKIFTDALLQTADCMRRNIRIVNQRESNHSDWFDSECRTAKQNANRALRTFRKVSTTTTKAQYVQQRKAYKALIRDKKNKYQNQVYDDLMKNLENSNTFWHILRKLRKRSRVPEISLETWKLHFETLFNKSINHSPISAVNQYPATVHDAQLDADISTTEVELGLAKLRYSKASGLDEIPSELLKIGGKYFLSYLTRLFNTIYNLQKFPRDWGKSVIVPIHKSGSTLDPHNYRGISLLNVLSKVFSSILTKRLQIWVEENDKLCKEQAGFRKEHSTVDHIFTLHCMITKSVYGRGRGKLYVAFIDYSKAFDSILRPCLWDIMAKTGISTKFINMVKSMYESVKACVRWDGYTSEFFNCPIGTKQGAKESPILFSLYMNSVIDFIRRYGKHGVQLQRGSDDVFLLAYADDVALVSTTPVGLQTQITNLELASKRVGLKVNKAKTKVMVFRRGGFLSRGEKWYLEGAELEVVNSFKYLGYTLTTKLSEAIALDHMATSAKQKTISLLKLSRTIANKTPKFFFKLFDAQVQPTLLYASELWGLKEHPEVEKSHLFACKRFLSLDVKSPNSLVYGETGRFPLVINSTIRAISYWFKLLKMSDHRLPKQALSILEDSNIPNNLNWLRSIELCLSQSGFAFVWYNKGITNVKGFLKKLKLRLQDCFRQELNSKMNDSQRFAFYRSFKYDFQCEKYLSTINIAKFRVALTRLRLGRNDLGVNAFSTDKRLCPFCTDCIEDEKHFLLECDTYTEFRQKYLSYFVRYMNSMGSPFSFLINGKGYVKTKKVAMFIYYAMRQRRQLLDMEIT